MDSANIDFGEDKIKLQGVELREIVDYSDPKDEAVEIVLVSRDENRIISFEELNGSLKECRIFISQGDSAVEYILAKMSGDILLKNVLTLEVTK